MQAQLPKAFADAKWQLRKLNDGDDWAVFNYLSGLAGGCAWFGNTDKKIVAAVKRAQKNLAFTA